MERIQIERISEKNKISDRSGGSGGHRVTPGAAETFDRFTTFLRWIWTPLSSVFGFDPDPGKAMLTTSGMVMLGIVFILNAYCYAYLNMEIGGNVLKRLKGGIRG